MLLLPAAAVAVAAPAPPEAGAAARTPQLTAQPSAVAPGGALTLEGRGFPRNAHIALFARPPHGEAIRIGGARTGRAGRFSATIRIRKQADANTFVALACHDGCRVKASARFRVIADER
jgi:hypothetical protein